MTISKKSVLSVSLFVLLLWGVVLSTFATPPLSPYTVTDNATDPTCAPGSANCYVSSVTADNGLTAVGSNVRLGGTLVQNTTIDTANREFSIKNGEMSFVSGADPLGLTAEVGAPVPGMGFVSDGVSTNGLQSWIFSGKLPNSQGNQLLNVFGNFDLANNKQGGMVVQDLETNLYNSDQFNSSGINVRPTEIGMYTRGRINLTADHEFNLASNSGYLRFNNYYAGRNDTTTTPSYSLGLTERGTNYGSLGAANFYGGYTGASTETYRITIDIAPGSTWTVGSTRNDNNFGSPNNVIFGGAYSGSNFNDYYYLYIESGGTTFNWGDGSGNNGSGVPIVAGTPIILSQGITVTFGSASYVANESWSTQLSYNGAPSTTFSWTDGSGGSGSGVTIPVGGGSVFLSQGVNVDFSSGIFISGEEWRMTIEERGVPAGANNFLYTDGSGFLRQAPTSLLGGGSFSLASQDEGTLLTSTTIGYNFIGAGVTATESGGLVTVNIPGGGGSGLTLQTNGVTNVNQSLLNLVAGTNVSLADDGSGNVTINASGGGGGADGSIYLNDGALTGNRTLNGGGNSLTFSNISDFTSFTNNSQFFLSQKVDPGNSKTYLSGMILRPEAGVQNGVVLVEQNVTDNVEVGISIDADQGIGFSSGAIGSGLPDYFFPRTDGTANQVLTTDGAGQLSWQNAGGGGTNIYNSNGTLTGNRTLDANGNNLTFSNLDQLLLSTQSGNVGIIMSDKGAGYGTILSQGQELISGNDHRSQIATDIGDGNYDADFDDLHLGLADTAVSAGTNTGAAMEVSATTGIRFRFRNGGVMSNYFFPRTDGTANQVLTTDGAGQLSWQNAGGGASGWSLTGNSGTIAGTNFIGTTDAQDFVIKVNGNEMGRFYQNTGTSLNSVAFGGGRALSNNMFVYGSGAGSSATNATYSNFVGYLAGANATNASYSNFIGYGAGSGATNATQSNFFGIGTGTGATNASNSNFFGYGAGQTAPGASDSNFFGQEAGYLASNASNSNFLGQSAGRQASNASNSNFLGQSAGKFAVDAFSSNFLGSSAGEDATNASNSNFLGSSAGYRATNASNSNFFGTQAGSFAANASNSIFIGNNAGYNDFFVNNTTNLDDFSILLGNYTSTGGFENSIALGQRATNTSSNQFMIGSTTRPIDETKIIGSLGTECTITTGTGMACTSDERLKTNITDLNSDTLSKLQNVRTVSYNWLQNPNSPTQIGFLAQNLEQYFPEMVMTDATGKKQVYYSQMTPILVEAIREMNLKIIDLSDMAKENTWRDALVAWFESSTNGIQKIFTKEVQTDKLCVGQTCVTESQLQQLLQAQNIQNTPQPTSPNPTTPDPLACTAPQVLNQTGDACVDPEPVPVSEETPPTDTPPTEEPPTVTE